MMTSTRMCARVRAGGDERGFVLVLVLFVIAVLTVTVSGALMVTQSDFRTADTGVRATRAFHLAQAGLTRYVGEQRPLTDSAVYSMGGARVVVRAARVTSDAAGSVYEVSSAATLSSGPGRTERREVRQLGQVSAGSRSVASVAALVTTARNISLGGVFSGLDQSASGACAESARGNVGGVAFVAGGSADIGYAYIQGEPRLEWQSDTAAMRVRASTEWGELTSPSTPFGYEIPAQSWPSFGTLPVTTYPTIRVRGDIRLTSLHSGRGLLVVDGRLDLGTGFVWDGVIVSGDLAHPVTTNAIINGTLIVGMSQTANQTNSIRPNSTGSPRFTYDACKVLAASSGISEFALLPNTWSEPPIY